jgi:hypothetical protein
MIHTPMLSSSLLSGTGGPGAAAMDVDNKVFMGGGGAGVCCGCLCMSK